MTENRLGKNSEWLWKSVNENKIWGAITPAINSEMGLSGWIKDDIWYNMAQWQNGTLQISIFSRCKTVYF